MTPKGTRRRRRKSINIPPVMTVSGNATSVFQIEKLLVQLQKVLINKVRKVSMLFRRYEKVH
jgi:hypothetical protein